MVTYWAHSFSRAVGREECCRQISPACVGRAHSLGHTGFAPVYTVCAFPVYTAQAPGGSAGEVSKAALGCMHFPGLSRSGSGSRALPKGADLVGPGLCALPRSEQHRRPGAWQVHSPQLGRRVLSPPRSQPLSFLGAQRERGLRCAVCFLWGANLWLRPSWWMSTVQDPRNTSLATGALLAVWWRIPSLGQRLPLPGSGCRPPASLPPAGYGLVCSWLALLWYLLSPLFSEQAEQCLRLELFTGKFSLSLFSLSGYPTVWVAISG